MQQTNKTAPKIYLASPHMSDERYEQHYIEQAFQTNWIAPLGENVDAFERELAEQVGMQHAAALSSGTAAIHLALKAAGVGQGDIVFCSTLTFVATANPILYEQAIPVFIDSDLATWNMCPKALEQAFQAYPNVKAVIVVHLYGLSADMDEILSICRRYNVTVIEDAAESLGAFYKGKASGTHGDIGIYSFNGNKIITTSGGGMLVSDDAKIVAQAKFLATQAKEDALHYEHEQIGYNYRISNISAGVGRGQLHVLEQRVAKKKEIFHYYKEHLADVPGVSFMPVQHWNEPNYWLTVITLSGPVTPTQLIQVLHEQHIESRPIWKPMHLQPLFKEAHFVGTQVAQTLFEQGVCLPSDTKMTEVDLQRVVSTIKTALENVHAQL